MEFKCMLILVLLILCFINGCISKKCWTLTSNGTKSWYCCDNHEEINGTCVECMAGYVSDFGEQCQKCPRGYYGLKCFGNCQCEDKESCHHIDGCIENNESVVIVEKESMNVRDIFQQSSSLLTSAETNNEESVLELTTPNDQIYRISYVTRSTFLPVTSHNGNSIPGLSEREIVVYSTGGLTCLVLLLLCFGRYKLKVYRNRSILLANENTRNNPQIHVISVGYIEGTHVYETIDESNLMGDPLETAVTNVGEISSSEESTDTEHHHFLLSDEYLNPYQSMVPDPEKHEYEFATDSCSYYSGSSGSTRTYSGYQNPYQQIIPYYEPHTYLPIQAEFHCLGSTSDENKNDDECRMEENLEQMEYEEETENKSDIDKTYILNETCSNIEIELNSECNSYNDKIPVDEIKDSLPVHISVDDVLSGESFNSLSKCKSDKIKLQ